MFWFIYLFKVSDTSSWSPRFRRPHLCAHALGLASNLVPLNLRRDIVSLPVPPLRYGWAKRQTQLYINIHHGAHMLFTLRSWASRLHCCLHPTVYASPKATNGKYKRRREKKKEKERKQKSKPPHYLYYSPIVPPCPGIRFSLSVFCYVTWHDTDSTTHSPSVSSNSAVMLGYPPRAYLCTDGIAMPGFLRI